MVDRSRKVSELTALASATAEDILVIVDDPSGVPVTKKITVGGLFGNVQPNTTIKGTFTANGTITLAGNTNITKPTYISNTLTVTSNVTFGSSVTVGSTLVINSSGVVVGPLRVGGPYANDAAAGAASVAVGTMYYNASGEVKVRLS